MTHKLRYLFAPLISLFLLVGGASFFMTFITVYLQLAGAEDFVIGGMHSAFYGGLFLGAFIIERGIQQVGHIRVFAAMASLTAASILVMGMTSNIYIWFAARFIAGFCIAAHYVTIESWMLVLSDAFDRGRILAVYMIALFLAQAISQYIIEFVDKLSTQPFLISALLVTLSIIPVTVTRKPQPITTDLSRYTLLQLFKESPFGFIGCFLSGMLISCVYSFTPAYAQENNISIANMMALTIVGGVVLQWPFGKASDYFDRRLILLLLAIILIIPSILMILIGHDPAVIFSLSFLIGGIVFTLYPLSLSQVCDRVGHSDLTGVTGLLLIVYGVGSTLGPITAPWIMIPFGMDGLYIYYVLISIVFASTGLWMIFTSKPVEASEQQEYVPLTHLTPVAYELDPRVEEENVDVHKS